MKTVRLGCLIVLGLTLALSASAEWEELNGPEGGIVGDLFEASDGTVYASTASAGIFYSTDGGASWNATAYAGPEEAVIAESPSGRMYYVDRFSETIYWSDDHFVTVETMTGPSAGSLESVYAFSDDVLLAAGRGFGALELHRTTDGGASWTSVLNAGFIGFEPIYVPGDGGLYVAFEIGYNLQFTDNQGESFTQLTDPSGDPGLDFLVPADDGNLVAGRGTTLYRSTDGGNSWNVTYDQDVNGLLMDGCIGPDGTIYARHMTGVNAYSDDDGVTWSTVQDNFGFFEATTVMIVTEDGFFMGGSRGCFVRDTVNDDWVLSNNGLIGTNPWSVTASSDGYVAVGTAGSVFYTMEPNGDWISHDDPGINVAINQDGTMFAGYLGTVTVSTDGGATWAQATGLPEASVRFGLFDSPGSTIFANVQGTIALGLYRSTDNGDSWDMMEDFLIDDMEIAPDGTIYIATGLNGFGISHDNGDSWSWPNLDFNQYQVEIGPGDVLYRATPNGAEISTDEGVSWENISLNALPPDIQFPSMTVNTLGVDGDGIVYMDMDWYSNWPELVTGGGVYVSTDEGATWDEVPGWRAKTFNSGQDGYFYAGTSMGVMRIPSGADVDEAELLQPFTHALAQNYPNPFNPSTSIRFSLATPGETKLTVYNIHGQRVATLTNGPLSAGLHTVQFDASTLASGVYVYRLVQEGKPVLARRMTLVK